jgi:exosortase/archaeosortase family protein
MDFSFYYGRFYFMVFQTKQVVLNKKNLNQFLMILLTPIIGFWHAWAWYFNRIAYSLEEGIGLFAIFTLIIFYSVRWIIQCQSIFKFSLWPIALLLIVYSFSFLFSFPSMIQAAIAFLTLLIMIYWGAFGQHPPLSFWMLIMTSLPVIPSLQFYLGYPARLLSASLTVPLLQLNGISVQRHGTYLFWNGEIMQFDAPCSGITMLWATLMITLMISFFYRFNVFKTFLSILIACIFVLLGNVLRATSLFYLENSSIFLKKSWMHEAIGVSTFLWIALGMLLVLTYIQKKCS